MRRLTLAELLKVTATPPEALKSLRRRDQIALAFGRREAYDSLSYIELDAVGLLLTDAIGRAYNNLTTAAQLLRIYGDVWAGVVGEAEADLRHDKSFCIVDLADADEPRPLEHIKAHYACGANESDPDKIAKFVERYSPTPGLVAVRVNCVNVSHLIRFIRKTAAKHGIDLLGAFMPPPSDPRFKEFVQPYEDLRDKAIFEVRARKAREALAREVGERARRLMEADL
jgi:hypothetical protein